VARAQPAQQTPAQQTAAVVHSAAPEGYAAQQQAYAAQQQAYAAQQEAYAAQQQAYAAQQQQQVYPPQQQAFPAHSQQQAYPAQPQPQAYPAQPQQQAYPAQPQQQAYAAQPQQQAYAAQSPQGYAAAVVPSGIPAFGGTGPSSGRPIPNADATAGSAPRLRFIRLTYLHLLGAILVFAGVEYLLMKNETIFMKVSVPILEFALGGGRYNWLAFLGIFMVVGYLADYWARAASSKALQYAGLGLYAVAEAVIFLPLLFIAELKAAEIAAKSGQDVHLIRDSAILTIALFSALTASVLITKKDFSFLRSGLMMGSAAALGIIVLAIVGGFNLGLVFSIAMVILAAGYVLYYTSQVLAHYHPGQHVAAALALFSAIALMFWYIIRIMMKLRQ
jgi:hypothetical protein